MIGKENEIKRLPEKRRSEILKLLEGKKFLEVSELMELFNISRPTAIRDLKILEKERLLKKTYGGISLIEKRDIYSFDNSLHTQIKEKKAIARAATQFINNGDSIALNTGVTTFEMAKYILEDNIQATVITNSLKVVDLFAVKNKTNILSLGGNLYVEGYGFEGSITKNNMNSVQGSTAFIGVHGLDIDGSMTLPWSNEADLVSIMMKQCKKVVILADYPKFGRPSLYKINYKLSDVDVIITDTKTEKKYLEPLEKENIKIIRADY